MVLDTGSKPFTKVGVVGSGFMGMHIALQCALHGYEVWLVDASEAALERAAGFQQRELDGRLASGQISVEERGAVLRRISLTSDLAEAGSRVELVIEAVSERLEVKREVFAQLDGACPSHTILATNSSTYRISQIEDATRRLDRVLNMHFMGEVWRRPVVELMRGSATSDETLQKARQFVRSIGLVPLMVLRQSTGFMYNRIWRATKKETLRVIAEGVATPEDIDRSWVLVQGATLGPCAMMDMVGLDVIRDIEMAYYHESGDPSDLPPQFLSEMIERGELGVKTGKGFYSYPNPAYEKAGWLTGDAD